MSVVVQFPGNPSAIHSGQRSHSGQQLGAAHPLRGGVISWVRPTNCACCGRPTLAGRAGSDQVALCRHCNPPRVA